MITETKCRRCTECRNSSHHWIDNPEFGVCEEGEHPGHQFCCKHCPMLGDECPVCYGDGQGEPKDDGPYPQYHDCLECSGDGVIPFDGVG